MTDHRAADLSYGHFGEASYDKDDNTWEFSFDPLKGKSILYTSAVT